MIKDAIRRLHISYLRLMSVERRPMPTFGTILIIAPHPDDEVIGCGGLISRLVSEGNPPHIIIMTGGGASHHGCCNTAESEIIHSRRQLTRNALAILGVPKENLHELNFPDGSISEDCEELGSLKSLLEKINPDIVLVPHWGEGWSDHVKTAEIVKNILPTNIEIWEYCVWMWYYNVWRGLDWENAAILEMTPQEHTLKLKAIDAYTQPLAPCGKPWSGVLPKAFLNANRWNKELYFKCQNQY